MPADSRHPSRQATDAQPPVPPRRAAAHELQTAARDRYRESVASGTPLTGATLGMTFDRSPRWGTDRIAEVRDADIGRNGRTPHSTRLPNSSNGNQTDPASQSPPTNSNGSTTVHSNGDTALPNGNDADARQLPIRNNGDRADASPATRGKTARRQAAAATARPSATGSGHKDPVVPQSLIVVTVAAVATVAVVTMVTSYTHTHDLAVMAGWGWLAGILPAAVDGLVVAGSTSLMVDRRLRGRTYPGHPLAWAAVAVGLASSMAANIVAVDPALVDMRVVRWVMAGYAPVALALAGHLLLRMLGERR